MLALNYFFGTITIYEGAVYTGACVFAILYIVHSVSKGR